MTWREWAFLATDVAMVLMLVDSYRRHWRIDRLAVILLTLNACWVVWAQWAWGR